jgi:hypothetical protein
MPPIPLQIEGAHAIGCTAVTWAPPMPPGALVSAQPPASLVKRIASSGCDNTVKVRCCAALWPALVLLLLLLLLDLRAPEIHAQTKQAAS